MNSGSVRILPIVMKSHSHMFKKSIYLDSIKYLIVSEHILSTKIQYNILDSCQGWEFQESDKSKIYVKRGIQTSSVDL